MTNVPAAQYLWVSTERQEYSFDFQSAQIANYAQENGFEVCQTYCDEAMSGLVIGRRRSLSQLLQDPEVNISIQSPLFHLEFRYNSASFIVRLCHRRLFPAFSS